MSGSQTGYSSIGGYASLMAELVKTFSGSGKTTQTDTSSGTGGTSKTAATASTNTTTSDSTADPASLAALRAIFATSSANSMDTSKTNALVQNILDSSVRGMTPIAGQANASGAYNTTSIPQLAALAASRAAGDASKAVLDYQLGQQQISTNAATSLVQATKSLSNTSTVNNPGSTTTTTPGTVTNSKSGQTGGSVSPLVPAGLIAAALGYSQIGDETKKKLLGLVGLGGSAAAGKAGNVVAATGAGSFNDFGTSDLSGFAPDTFGDSPLVTSTAVQNFLTVDNLKDYPTSLEESFNPLSDSISSQAGTIADSVSSGLSSAFSGVSDALSSGWDSISSLFDF